MSRFKQPDANGDCCCRTSCDELCAEIGCSVSISCRQASVIKQKCGWEYDGKWWHVATFAYDPIMTGNHVLGEGQPGPCGDTEEDYECLEPYDINDCRPYFLTAPWLGYERLELTSGDDVNRVLSWRRNPEDCCNPVADSASVNLGSARLLHRVMYSDAGCTHADSGNPYNEEFGDKTCLHRHIESRTEEFTDSELLELALAAMPGYESGGCSASMAWSYDENGVDPHGSVAVTSLQYTITVGSGETAHWDVTFTPTGGAPVVTPMTSASTQDYEIIPDQAGTWEVSEPTCE